jgi:hypothetical protein
MKKLRALGIGLMLLVMVVAATAIIRPPFWRNILYEGMFDACRDESITRAQIWMFLGASPDGASDYDAGRGYNGFEFGSHVNTVAYDKDCQILALLLAKGASPNLDSPLATAIHEHNEDAVKILLDAGANPRYSDRWTAVDQAQSLKFHDLIPMIEPYLKKSQAQQADSYDGE